MTLRDVTFVLRNTVAVFLDPTRLGDLLEVCEILNRGSFRRLHAELARDAHGRRLLAERPELTSRAVDLTALRALPQRTLGRTFVDHLDAHQLDLDALALPVRREGEAADTYLLRRYRGNHDLWHALLGLGVSVREEVLVNAFSWGQLGLPQNHAVVTLGALRHLATLRAPGEAARFLVDIRRHLRSGRRAAPLLAVRWEDLWSLDVDEVRRALRVV